MKEICYIINFWFGERRVNVDAFEDDKLCYVKSQIETLEKYKHSLSKIVFSFNVEPEHYQYLSEAIQIIPKRIQNTNIEINIRENFGMSYGAFSDIFGKYQDKYDYYIFNEDDYVIVDDNFDDYLMNKFESLPNCGYLCGLVRERAHRKLARHAGMSSGISSYKCLKELYDKFGELPHSKGIDYHENEVAGQTLQTVEIRKLGYEIYDIREEYRSRFWARDDEIPNKPGVVSVHFMWQDKDLFLPAKSYFNEPHMWIDRVDTDMLRMECDYNSTKYYGYEWEGKNLGSMGVKKRKKIFVVGFGGSGTRVVQMILERAGYFVGGEYLNRDMYDILGKDGKNDMLKHFDGCYFRNNCEPLKGFLQEILNGKDEWSFKFPHFTYLLPLLKEWYPDSQFIYVFRNPIDTMVNPNHHEYNQFGKLPSDASLENKVKYHMEITKMAFENMDYHVKFEDLCFSPNKAISDLLTFANIEDYNVDDYTDLIKIPKSIGRGKVHYERFKQMEEFSYIKQLGYLLD